jgi:hypothetical protein
MNKLRGNEILALPCHLPSKECRSKYRVYKTIILPAVLYGYGNVSVILMDEYSRILEMVLHWATYAWAHCPYQGTDSTLSGHHQP